MVFATVSPVTKPFIPVVATDSMVAAPYSAVTVTSVMVNVSWITGAESAIAVNGAINAVIVSIGAEPTEREHVEALWRLMQDEASTP